VKRVNVRDIGEFGLIQRIRSWMAASRKDLIRGIGDDVAVMEMGGKALLATTDILIEGIHFHQSWIDPFSLGKKAILVNVSDIAAMGGIPKYFLISLGLPKSLPVFYVSQLYHGLKEGAKSFRADLVGGDTSLSSKIILNIALLGEGKKQNLLFRNGAKVGNDLWVSGTLGDSALGLKMLRKNRARDTSKTLIERHLSPTPRLHLGQALANHHLATAMIDVSDGLLIDTSHLLEESGVGVLLFEDTIPLSKEYRKFVRLYSRNPYRLALTGGEDYELLFTAPRENRERISSLSRSLKLSLARIGEILPKKRRLLVARRGGKICSPSSLGFDHFK
jgi:thiamine-monophosphate kinase